MQDKEKLGKRYACYQCGTKFYDLNRPVPSCPSCSADQREAPQRDIRSLLSSKGKRRAPLPTDPLEDDGDDPGAEAEEEDEDSLGLLGDDDEDDEGEEEEEGGELEEFD